MVGEESERRESPDEQGKRSSRLLLATKPAVRGARLDPPLTAGLDDKQQPEAAGAIGLEAPATNSAPTSAGHLNGSELAAPRCAVPRRPVAGGVPLVRSGRCRSGPIRRVPILGLNAR
jgi:hypothetical protein